MPDASQSLSRQLQEARWLLRSIEQRFAFFSNVSDPGAFRGNFDITAVTAIRRWFSWQLTISDRYLSNPVPGRKKNDILFSTGVRLSFAK